MSVINGPEGGDRASQLQLKLNKVSNEDTFSAFLEEKFKKSDADNSQSLTRQELQDMLCDILGADVATAEFEEPAPDGSKEKVVDVLLDVLDANGSASVELTELKQSWRAWFGAALQPKRALLIIDVQNDFISGTLSLSNCPAGHNGAEVVDVINSMREAQNFDVVAISQDWHTHEHVSFHETVTAGASPSPLHSTQDKKAALSAGLFDTVVLTAPDGKSPMPQTLWPRHCVQGSWGAKNHDGLVVEPSDVRVYKGTNPEVDSYSAFFDNSKYWQTILLDELRRRGVTHVYCTGIALDVCVAFTALHAAEAGFVSYVVEDACRGVDAKGIAEKKKLLTESGVHVVKSTELPNLFALSSLDEAIVAARTIRRARKVVEIVNDEDGFAGAWKNVDIETSS